MRLTAALPQIRVRNSGIQSECGDDARTEGYEGKFRHRNRRSPIPPVLLRLRLRPPRRNFRHGPGNTRPGPWFLIVVFIGPRIQEPHVRAFSRFLYLARPYLGCPV